MATLFGAWALRAETTTGSLKPGKSADLAIVALPDRDAEDPFALLLESDLPVIGTVFEGDFVAGRWSGTVSASSAAIVPYNVLHWRARR